MSSFKDNFNDRLGKSNDAKKAMLQRFKAQPGPDDPEVLRKRAEREAIARARDERLATREAERRAEAERIAAEIAAREAAEAKDRAEREAREAIEAAEHQIALEAQKKAERDARYAARKARKKAGKG